MAHITLWGNKKAQLLKLFRDHTDSSKQTYDYDKISPGDYLAIAGVGEDSDCIMNLTGDYVIVKVLSAQKAHNGFFSASDGKMTVELPDGSTETLDSYCNAKNLWKFLNKERYFYKYSGFRYPKLRAYRYVDRTALKEDMQEYYERKDLAKAETRRREEQARRAEEEKRRREAELARKNASVSDEELRRAFRGEEPRAAKKPGNPPKNTLMVLACTSCGKLYYDTESESYRRGVCEFCEKWGEKGTLMETRAYRSSFFQTAGVSEAAARWTDSRVLRRQEHSAYRFYEIDNWRSLNKNSVPYKYNQAWMKEPDKFITVCPCCRKNVLALPTGKGRIQVTCPVCKGTFEEYT